MKVQICETVSVDVETTVEVNANDVLMEFYRRIEEAEVRGDAACKTAFLPLVDFATKLLARVPEKCIKKCADSQITEVIKRLQKEAERWHEIYVSAE